MHVLRNFQSVKERLSFLINTFLPEYMILNVILLNDVPIPCKLSKNEKLLLDRNFLSTIVSLKKVLQSNSVLLELLEERRRKIMKLSSKKSESIL